MHVDVDRNKIRSIGANVISQHHRRAHAHTQTLAHSVAARFARVLIILRCGRRRQTACHASALALITFDFLLFISMFRCIEHALISRLCSSKLKHTQICIKLVYPFYVLRFRTVVASKAPSVPNAQVESRAMLSPAACAHIFHRAFDFRVCVYMYGIKTVAACKRSREYEKQRRKHVIRTVRTHTPHSHFSTLSLKRFYICICSPTQSIQHRACSSREIFKV